MTKQLNLHKMVYDLASIAPNYLMFILIVILPIQSYSEIIDCEKFCYWCNAQNTNGIPQKEDKKNK